MQSVYISNLLIFQNILVAMKHMCENQNRVKWKSENSVKLCPIYAGRFRPSLEKQVGWPCLNVYLNLNAFICLFQWRLYKTPNDVVINDVINCRANFTTNEQNFNRLQRQWWRHRVWRPRCRRSGQDGQADSWGRCLAARPTLPVGRWAEEILGLRRPDGRMPKKKGTAAMFSTEPSSWTTNSYI